MSFREQPLKRFQHRPGRASTRPTRSSIMVVNRPARALRAVLAGAVALALGMASAPPAGADPGQASRGADRGRAGPGRGRRADEFVRAREGVVPVELVELGGRAADDRRLHGAHRRPALPVPAGQHVREGQGSLPGRLPLGRSAARQLHQSRDRRFRVVGADLDPGLRPHQEPRSTSTWRSRSPSTSRATGTRARAVAASGGTGNARTRTPSPTDSGSGSPPSCTTGCLVTAGGSAARRTAGTGSPAAA